jgi:hypothetical protein
MLRANLLQCFKMAPKCLLSKIGSDNRSGHQQRHNSRAGHMFGSLPRVIPQSSGRSAATVAESFGGSRPAAAQARNLRQLVVSCKEWSPGSRTKLRIFVHSSGVIPQNTICPCHRCMTVIVHLIQLIFCFSTCLVLAQEAEKVTFGLIII